MNNSPECYAITSCHANELSNGPNGAPGLNVGIEVGQAYSA